MNALYETELAQCRDQLARCKAILAWYADKENWINDSVDIGVGAMEIPMTSECGSDMGFSARLFLEELENE